MLRFSLQRKWQKICEFLIVKDLVNTDLANELEGLYQVATELEPPELSSCASQKISHLLRFDLDFGGDSKTAKSIDVVAQELASEGWIQECETTSDIEDQLLSIYQQKKEIENQIREATETIDTFYFNFIYLENFKFKTKIFKLLKILFVKLFLFSKQVLINLDFLEISFILGKFFKLNLQRFLHFDFSLFKPPNLAFLVFT